MIDPSQWQMVWDVAQFALTGVVGIYVYLSQREQVRRDALQRLENDVDGRLEELHTAVARLESKLETQPTWSKCSVQVQRIAVLEEAFKGLTKASDLARVHTRIDEIDKGLAELRGELKSSVHLLQTIDHHLRSLSHPA
jgi:hypothetical protein